MSITPANKALWDYKPNLEQGWIGFDYDGTLFYYDPHDHKSHGAPIPRMIQRLRNYLAEKHRVKIMTARASDPLECVKIQERLVSLGIPPLEVTNTKDYLMIYLYDDRARQVVPNTGVVVGES